MKDTTKLAGVAAVCAGACAVSVLPAVLAGGGLAALAGGGLGIEMSGLIAVILAGGLFLWRRSVVRGRVAACGCASTDAADPDGAAQCTLPARQGGSLHTS